MNKDVGAGQAVYSKKVLSIYDLWVLGFSNHYLWKCPTRLISQQFADLVTANHLDVGVGTGYYLKQNLPAGGQRIALVDLNENSLESTAKAIEHLKPEIYCRNVLEPFGLGCEAFDSVSINYLLHCLPGSMSEKSIVFSHIREVMSAGGVVFGSTILGQGTEKNAFAQKLMSLYNKKGIFCNDHDELGALEEALHQYFLNVKVEVIGCVALFSATKA
ncbi:class I SAM-dependent methyltransferase [Photobacterium gaetbulicola]|uniref:Methyltransferase type 12 n=1 Tax=Photobacterium gaetbulicola Gung47 TaxID=658445 RepID=A0A0C5WQ40_9GAMM|nr:class I SAM-dependent methyltransferase [Photobacterium gaetbulicola]AJR05070.1 methyltransferase type 12 [Photobacterium gaetbulicola Gung47]PSU06900.1 class I SAM-dependent methyltransferase [Photobacterium gaetbulicola]